MPCVVSPARTVRAVTIARQAAGLSRRDLSGRTGITLPRIVALETSEMPLAPTDAECAALAEVTGTMAHFYRLGDVELGRIIMCGTNPQPETFCRCGEVAEYACDGVYLGGTCDEPLCHEHAVVAVGEDRHLCARCA